METIMIVSHISLWVLFIIQSLIVLALLRQVGTINLRIGPLGARMMVLGPEVGDNAPKLHLVDMGDESKELHIPPEDGRDWVVIFVTPGCPTCQTLIPGVKVLLRETHDNLGWVLVALGERTECELLRYKHGLERFPFCHGDESVRDLYAIAATPYMILVRRDGKVLSKGLVNHIEHLESVLSMRRMEDEQSLSVGDSRSLLPAQTNVQAHAQEVSINESS